ncbi:hypothetical protein EUX98_g2808 [Antrodiella citrinella]|uniref:PIH1 N-terminal domain-containing protein n=1 Tax=Antrodiella citrinella TaxID=2447956 RepID=A0A4V3XJ17_9APHY|nr:hypothetical protein EUX98_g2808 [Antrodiella citrinella]
MNKANAVRITLSPSPGYCFKTTALSSVVSSLASQPSQPPVAPTIPGTLFIQKGTKVFVNIAWDQNVPAAPEASEATIRRAMRGGEEELKREEPSFKDVLKDDGEEEEDWTVPVVVSEPRQDIDKSGNPSVVFDCVYNGSLQSRVLRDADFRAFINELSLQRIELQTTAASVPSAASPHGLLLSRDIKTPNIASKGKLAKRTVLVPRTLYAATASEQGKKLVKEVQVPGSSFSAGAVKLKEDDAKKPKKGILKGSAPKIEKINESSSTKAVQLPSPKKPTHKWSEESNKRCLVVDVPGLTRAIHAASVLDVEPRRIIFDAPPLYALDLSETNVAAKKEFDVDGAKAEWRVKEGRLLIYV